MGIFKKLFKDEGKKVIYNLLIVLAVGVTLLIAGQVFLKPNNTIPNSGTPPDSGAAYTLSNAQANTASGELERGMEEILSLVEGAGKVKVLISYAKGPETVVARNTTEDESRTTEKDASGGTREQYQSKTQSSVVTLKRKDGSDEPLTLYETAPVVEGIIIVAEGGGNIIVKDALIRAASGLLGIAVHKVTVLPMEIKN